MFFVFVYANYYKSNQEFKKYEYYFLIITTSAWGVEAWHVTLKG